MSVERLSSNGISEAPPLHIPSMMDNAGTSLHTVPITLKLWPDIFGSTLSNTSSKLSCITHKLVDRIHHPYGFLFADKDNLHLVSLHFYPHKTPPALLLELIRKFML